LYKQGQAYFEIAGAGHEALLIGLSRSLRSGYDWFFPYYRDLALALALGVTPEDVLLHARGFCRRQGLGGRQMPHHFGRADLNIVTQSSATGSQCLPALGCAEADPLHRLLASSTECRQHPMRSPTSHSVMVPRPRENFGKAINTASQKRLPFCMWSPTMATRFPDKPKKAAAAPISELVRGFPGFFVASFDGCDYFESRRHRGNSGGVREGRPRTCAFYTPE